MLLKTNKMLAVVIFLLLLPSCGGVENRIIGKWENLEEGVTFEFFEGGTVVMSQDGEGVSGTYTVVQDNQIQLEFSGLFGSQTMLLTDVTVSGETLSFGIDGSEETGEFSKVK